MTGLCLTEWPWDKFVFDRMAMGQFCGCQNSNGTGLCLINCQWDRIMFDRLAMGQVCV